MERWRSYHTNEIESIWNRLTETDYHIATVNWRDYVDVDDGIAATAILDIETISEEIVHVDDTNDNDGKANEEAEIINIEMPEKNAIDNAFEILQTAIELTEDVPDEVQIILFEIESFFKQANTPANLVYQSKITSFLK